LSRFVEIATTSRARKDRRTIHLRDNGPAEWATRHPLQPAQLQGSSSEDRPTVHFRGYIPTLRPVEPPNRSIV
jgi:hypothetical protein